MSRPLHFCSALLAACLLTSGAALADTVFLKDGNRLSGTITEIANNAIILDTSFAGQITVKQSSILGMSTDRTLTARTRTGEIITGTLDYDYVAGQRITSANNATTMALSPAVITQAWDSTRPISAPQHITAPQTTTQIPATDISTADIAMTPPPLSAPIAAPIAPPIATPAPEPTPTPTADIAPDIAPAPTEWGLWSGNVKFSFNGSDGNTDKINLGSRAAATRDAGSNRLILSLQNKYEKTDGKEKENEIIARSRFEQDLSERLFTFGQLTLEHDKAENIELRTNITGGLGYFLIREDHHELKPRIGVGYEITSYDDDSTDKDIILSAGYDYRIDLTDKLRFKHGFTYLPAFDDPTDNYRLESDAVLAYPINDAKTWNIELGLEHKYDASPATDAKKLDTYYTIGISRNFN